MKMTWTKWSFPLVMLAVAGSVAAQELALESFPQRGARQPALFVEDGAELVKPRTVHRGGQAEGSTAHESGDVSLGASAGLTFGPGGFLATGEADFWFSRFFSVGPLVQISAGRSFIFAATGGPKITFDFEDHEFTNLVKPYAQAGAGVAVVSKGRRGDHRTELGLLLMFGFGVDFYVTEEFSLGSGLLFNILPTEPRGELFYLGWKFIEAKVHF